MAKATGDRGITLHGNTCSARLDEQDAIAVDARSCRFRKRLLKPIV
jgi:hypothetical protein